MVPMLNRLVNVQVQSGYRRTKFECSTKLSLQPKAKVLNQCVIGRLQTHTQFDGRQITRLYGTIPLRPTIHFPHVYEMIS